MPQELTDEITISSEERKDVLALGKRSAMSRKRKVAADKEAEATQEAKRARASEAQQAELGRGQRGVERAAAAAAAAAAADELVQN